MSIEEYFASLAIYLKDPDLFFYRKKLTLILQKAIAVDKATERMTDASKYTGSHKERFDADGKGKGMDGRVDKVDGSGYVGNYKNAGTYDKKH